MTKLDELNMSKNHVFKNDEELNNALNEVSEAYSKPPTNSDYVFVGILLVLLPIAGIMGYIYDWSWLFYIVGGLITLMEIIFLFTGALRCLGSVLLIISCGLGYFITQSVVTGLLLGSCVTASLLSIGLAILICSTGFSTITNLFKKN